MSAIQSGLFRLSLFLTLLFSVNIANAQNYQILTSRIDSLVGIGLPKSALAEVDKLDELARKEKNAPMQIKAVIYRVTFQTYLEENAMVNIINRLKLDIQQASYPVKPVLQSLLANMYQQYYQRNRWQFNQRSRLEKPSDDFTLWDLQTIINETTRLYRASLSDFKQLQSTPIGVLDGVLIGDTATRYLRPTLYDLLVHRALDFFLADEPALTKPKLAFALDDARFFGDSQTFAGLTVKTTDTSSTYYIGIQLLQQATLSHLQNHQDEALADLDIKRLEFLYSKASLADKDFLYTGALKQIALIFSSRPISANALFALAKYEQSKDSLRSAMQYAQKAAAVFPKSTGGQNADVLIKQIRQKELSVTVENRNIPGEPILAEIQYSNIKTVGYKIYKLTEAQNKQREDEKGNYNNNYSQSKSLKWLALFLKNTKFLQKTDLQLPDPQDYSSHRAEFKIDALSPGNYLIRVEDKQSADSSLIQFADFKVSRIAYTSRKNPDGYNEVRVMDRKTGEPLKNVAVKMSIRDIRSSVTVVKTGSTDKTGLFRSIFSEQGVISVCL